MDARTKAARELGAALDSELLRALSDPTRVALIKQLVLDGAADVDHLARAHRQDRSVISRHLATLRDAGLVRARKEGRHVIYELDGPALLDRIEQIWTRTRALVALCCPP